ncbi:hypothetical protein QAD02_002960 [Eretmocerus hayati]|uniref:Uncharacterized protein n=1 Tax=Eretmocerus hayati TaxID=131215 RepID=A0ACC2NLB6_9HYME|nr:hypothetical protein QAD02_002960 [Eretmocerus hayati]
MVITYLEHIVYVWEDNNPLFHNIFVHQYTEKCLPAMTPSATPAEKENILHIRQKLQKFLETSQHCTPETVLRDFLFDCSYEERAIQQAVFIYINLLNDVSKPIQYRKNVYERHERLREDKKQQKEDGAEEVYVTLIRQLLRPDERDSSELLGLVDASGRPAQPYQGRTAQPGPETALELLEEHAGKIEPMKALQVAFARYPNGDIVHFSCQIRKM